jgi:ubiquinone/menaquinone biosynthesis C-methylase UbiE/uncharacterized protein YbaR (Trm112 family)
MTPELIKYLCDPITKEPLSLINSQVNSNGMIVSGGLKSPNGKIYPIINGVPRFICSNELCQSVKSFGDEWNYFNFTEFKAHWINHTVANTFGSRDVFRNKIIVDAGGGSGAQTLWMLESGAKHVIMLELSHSVDEVVKRNLEPTIYNNYDVIQCSIDAPPIKEQSIDGIVICHNVIQHTPSVEKTAQALFALVAPGGEFVFNCYKSHGQGLLRWLRYNLLYRPLRGMISSLPFGIILIYSKIMSVLRMIPVIGKILEFSCFCVQGDVPVIQGEGNWKRLLRRIKVTRLNTFDLFGAHKYQHHKSDEEIANLIATIQPDLNKVVNAEKYFSSSQPIGCALRVFR